MQNTKTFIYNLEKMRKEIHDLRWKYHHCIAFERNYIAEPQIKVYENTSIIDVSMSIENIKKTDMELMYDAY